MKQNLQYCKTRSTDKGAVLILTALLCFALLGLMALVIDFSFVGSSHEQHERLAEGAAIAGLHTFLSEYRPEDPTTYGPTAVSFALQKIREVTKKNVTISHQGSELSDQIGLAGGAVNEDGEVQFGKWWEDCQPDPLNPPKGCHCGLPGSSCFEAGDPTLSGNGEFGQAIRVTFTITNSSPIPALFSKVLGYRGFTSTAQATAQNIPLHGLFLVDLSTSMQWGTHRKYFNGAPVHDQFAFKFDSDLLYDADGDGYEDDSVACPEGGTVYDSLTGITYLCSCTGSLDDDPGVCTNCRYNLVHSAPALHRQKWYGESGIPILKKTRDDLDPTKHFKEDYRCLKVPFVDDIDLDGIADGPPTYEYYLVDGYQQLGTTETDPTYSAGPEPLATVLSALYYASTRFESRRINGDMIGAIFFDEDSAEIHNRTFPLLKPDSQNVPMFKDLQDAVNILTDPRHDPSRFSPYPKNFSQYPAFPRVRGFGANATTHETDIPGVLTDALRLLNEAPGSQGANNFVLIISDGLTNCVSPAGCSNNGTYFYDSLYNGIINGILPKYQTQNIAIHFMSVGFFPVTGPIAGPVPNSLNIVDENGDLMDDGKVREAGIDWVYSGSQGSSRSEIAAAYDAARPPNNVPFYYANWAFYDITKKTNGFFFPLRPSVRPPSTPPLQPITLNDIRNGITITEAHLQLSDPTGRSPKAQVEDYIDKLFEYNSIVLVEEKH